MRSMAARQQRRLANLARQRSPPAAGACRFEVDDDGGGDGASEAGSAASVSLRANRRCWRRYRSQFRDEASREDAGGRSQVNLDAAAAEATVGGGRGGAGLRMG